MRRQLSNLRSSDATGTSDPFVVWSIKPNYAHWHRRGGVRGRSCKTGVSYNSLFPRYAFALGTLCYYGTRSDLEAEVVNITVYDWDVGSRNDVIGFAKVQLNGLLAESGGHISTALASWEGTGAQKHLVPAGHAEGGVQLLTQPALAQFGSVISPEDGTTYLAVQVVGAADLSSRRPNSAPPNAYAAVKWDACLQQTRVVRASANPKYGETLYFPVRLLRLTKEEIAKKGDVSIYLYDHSAAHDDDIGFARIQLEKITSAPLQRIGTDRTRIFAAEALPLVQPGYEGRQGAVHVLAYFTPDLPSDIQLQPRASAAGGADGRFVERAQDWRGKIPRRLANKGNFMAFATDETNTKRFLPTYLTKSPPPPDVHDPMALACMVHCITFETDRHIRDGKGTGSKGGTPQEVWLSPNYFLDVKKGGAEDHAVLLCNLLLGMGMDAYLAVGRLKGGIVQHVWVLTREPTGDVRMWETTKGTFYTLPGRWSGLFMDGAQVLPGSGAADPTADADASRLRKLKKRAKRAQALAETAIGQAADRIAQDRARRAAEKASADAAKAREVETGLLYIDEKEIWAEERTGRSAYDTPRDADGLAAGEASNEAHRRLLQRGERSVALWQQAGEKTSLVMRSAKALNEASKDATDGARNLKGLLKDRLQQQQKLQRLLGAFTASGDAPAEAEAAAGDVADRSTVAAGATAKHVELPRLTLPSCEDLPYESVEVLANHENVWANLDTAYYSHAIGFDLDNEERWLPFIKPGEFEPPPPQPFFVPAGIGPKLPLQRLSSLRQTVLLQLREAYATWRTTRSLKVRWATTIEALLQQGLELLEVAHCSSRPTARRAVDKWRGQLMVAVPLESQFVGRALSFSITDPGQIVAHVMRHYQYHCQLRKDVQFAIAVQCFPHYCAVCSTRVYVGYLASKPVRKEDEDGAVPEPANSKKDTKPAKGTGKDAKGEK